MRGERELKDRAPFLEFIPFLYLSAKTGQSVVIRGESAYLPNVAASPTGPLRFNLDTHAFVNVIGGVNSSTPVDFGALNLHLGARNPEAGKRRVFFANPWAIGFNSQVGDGFAYVVS